MNEPVEYGEQFKADMKRKRRTNLVMCAVLFLTAIAALFESLAAIKTGATVSNRVGGIPYTGWEGAFMFGGCAVLMGIFFWFSWRDRS
jgi:hypothetical protein